MLTAYPIEIYSDGTSLIVYEGAVGLVVEWSLVGAGTITPISTVTDERGLAAALYRANGTPGDAVIGVSHA